MFDDNDAGRTADLSATRRSFMATVGAGVGAGLSMGGGAARPAGGLRGVGATFYVYRADGEYRVARDAEGTPVYSTTADGNAEAAFQYAFDHVPERGGTVAASPDTFHFGAPATLCDRTTLTGTGGTRFVASKVGSRKSPFPDDSQENPLAVGHDLIRARGDDVAITNVAFDADGTVLDNNAIQADGCEGVLIANNRTVGGFQMAISFTRCENVVVRGNEVVDPNWYGITSRGAPAGSEFDLQSSSNVVVAHNRVSGMKFNNIATYRVSNFAILGNVVFDGGHSLIACSPAQYGTIVGNVCRDLDPFLSDPGGEAGLEIEYKETHAPERSHDITVSGNHVENCPVGFVARTVPADSENEAAREDKRPYSFTVNGNAINGCEEAGIRVRSGDSCVLATNTLRDNATALDVVEEYTRDVQRGLNATRN